MLPGVPVSVIRTVIARTKSTVVVCSNGAIACWHPPVDIPFEHTRPIPSQSQELKNSFARGFLGSSGPKNVDLKEIFYTDKNEWFTRTREDRLRSVSAPLPRKK